MIKIDKKIGILTFYNTTNYGALLQMYALYNCIKQNDVSVEIVRYYCKAVEERENLRFHNVKSLKHFLRILLLKIPNGKKQKHFRSFEKSHFNYSEKKYDEENLNLASKVYDRLIVGSDQIWNLKLSGNDFGFFLKGVNGVRKYSYAASFGSETINNSDAQKISPFLEEFDKITVREISGLDIVNGCCNKSPKFVVDPTFLMEAFEWRILIEKSIRPKKPYILLYLVQNKKRTLEYARQLAKNNGWEIKYINISPYHVLGVDNIRSATPTEFLWLVDNAELVITGSYHGLSLSINFSKPVYYELSDKEKNYNARISSLISTLEMQDCRLVYEKLEVPKIDYIKVQEKLDVLRTESKKILYSIVDG